MESPTGPLQRIARLEEEANQLDELPSLPSLSGIDFTVQDSPPPRAQPPQQTPSASKKQSKTTDILPFTSTPAPAAAVLRSQSTIFLSGSRPSSDGSTRTIKTVTQQSYPRSSTFSSLPQELSADQISIEKVDYGSGSGTDSAGSAKRAKRSPRVGPSPVQQSVVPADVDEHDLTSSSVDSYFNPLKQLDDLDDLASTSFHQAVPSPPAAPKDHDYSLPLTGDESAVTGSAQARRIAAQTANVSTRRKITARRMSTSDAIPRLAVSSSSSTPSLPSPPQSTPAESSVHFVNKNFTLGENASGLPSANVTATRCSP